MKPNKLYKRPANSNNVFGIDEKVWYVCGAGTTLVNLLEEKNLFEGTTIRIITGNYRNDKWGFGTDWYKYAERKLKEGVKIKAYGGPKIEASKAIGKLTDLGMEILEINDHIGNATEHYVTVDNPAQIWAEAKHVGFHAYGCIYTDKPFKDVWRDIDNYFKELEISGKWLTHDDIVKLNA